MDEPNVSNRAIQPRSGKPEASATSRKTGKRGPASPATTARGSNAGKPQGQADSVGRPKPKRARFGPLPKPAESIEVPYARCREELKDLSDAELTMVVANSRAYRKHIGAICQKLDAKRGRTGGKRGIEPLYSSWECELVFLFKHISGLRSLKEARDRLAGDRGVDARHLFGLDRPRGTNPNRKRCLLDGVQSEATLCRHKRRFGERRRRGAYQRVFRDLRHEHLTEHPQMREEARLTGLDGTKVETHFTCPKVDPKTKEVVNRDAVTCADGGYVPFSAGPDKSGHGWNAVILTTFSGLPLGYELTPLHAGESETGARVIERFGREVRPLLDADKIGVVAADGAFNSNPLRRASREAGLVENVHAVSHGSRQRSRDNARAANARRLPIDGYPNWSANGHGELICDCGHGQTRKEIRQRPGKPVSVSTVGTCKTCGPISITSGGFKRVQNVGRKGQAGYARVQPGEQDQAALSFGNPLTYNDKLAAIYGRKRHAHGEGLHGVLVSRFGLCKGKRWFRRSDQAETELAIVFSILHALAIEQRKRAAAAADGDDDPASKIESLTPASATGPPGQAQAA